MTALTASTGSALAAGSTAAEQTRPAAAGARTSRPAPGDDPDGPALRRRRRRWWAVVATGVLATVALIALSTPVTTVDDLDPLSAAPVGSMALARLLAQHGVGVRRVLSAAGVATGGAPGGTLVVVHPQLLGPAELDLLADYPGTLVLVEPDAPVLDVLAPGITAAGQTSARTVGPGCSDPDAVAAGPTRAGGDLYLVDGTTTRLTRSTVCYPDPRVPLSGSVVFGELGPRLVEVLGQADVLRNEYLAQDGNAALALRVLGRSPTVVWYLPSLADSAGSGVTLTGLVPGWIWWVCAQLCVALATVMIWRARRLGRLVVEPLPVIVRAAETQEGRARLYRQARARSRAAATLRTAALRRLAARMAVPPDTSPTDLADLVARAGAPPGLDVRGVLLGPAPTDDAELVRLADRLDAVEAALRGTSALAGTAAGEGATDPPTTTDKVSDE